MSAAIDRGGLDALGPRSFLVVYDHVPRPGESGADLRLVQIVELLRAAGHRVTLIGRNADSKPEHTRALEALGVTVRAPDPDRTPFVRPLGASIDLAALCAAERFDAAILYQYFWSGLGVGEQYLPILRRVAPWMRVVLLSDDCHALREERRAEKSGSQSDRERARGLFEKEADSYALADALWTITREDAERMRAAWPALSPRVIAFAQAEVRERVPGFETRDGLLFLGSGANDANVQAVRWFVSAALPLVRLALPDVKLRLVGEPPAGGWGFDDPAIETLGRAADLAPCFDRARVFVSPVTYGTGLKTKNVQALGHGLPVVLTTISAEGLELEGELARCVHDDAAGFARSVVALHEDAELWSCCSTASLAHARAAFGRERTARDLAEGLRDLFARAPGAWPEGHVGPSFQIDARDPALAVDRRLGRRTLAHVELAQSLAKAGRLDAAVRELRMAFCDLVFVEAEAPAFGDLHAQLAVLYAAAEEHEECIAAARAAAALNPDLASELRGAAERAREGAERALEALAHPATIEACFAAAARCYARDELERAAGHLLAALDRDPGSVRAWNDLGAVLWKSGAAEDALGAFENALLRNPSDPDALANRASVLATVERA